MTLPSNGADSLRVTFIWTGAPLSALRHCAIISVETSLLLLSLSQADSCSKTAAKAPESKAVGPPTAAPPGVVTPKAAPETRGRQRERWRRERRANRWRSRQRASDGEPLWQCGRNVNGDFGRTLLMEIKIKPNDVWAFVARLEQRWMQMGFLFCLFLYFLGYIQHINALIYSVSSLASNTVVWHVRQTNLYLLCVSRCSFENNDWFLLSDDLLQ